MRKIIGIGSVILILFIYSCSFGNEGRQITPSIFLWANKLYSEFYNQPSQDLVQGLAANDTGDFFTALDLCKKVTQEEPNNRAAAICYIRALISTENYSSADQYLLAYQKQFGKDNQFLIEQARYFALTQRYNQAEAILKEILQNDPSDDSLLNIKAYMLTHNPTSNKGY